jgi:hypothetical protein
MQAPNLEEGQTELPETNHSVPEQSNRISTRKLVDEPGFSSELMRGYLIAQQASPFPETALSTVQRRELQW